MENPRGGGGLPFSCQNGKSGEVGGSLVNFPPWWGYGYFLEPHNKEENVSVFSLIAGKNNMKYDTV